MIYTRMAGGVRLTNLIEYVGPTHDPAELYPDFNPAMIERNRDWLTNAHWYANLGRLVIAIQLWIVHAGDKVILVDAGVGNAKPRGPARMHMLNTLVPHWLAAANAGFDRVTHVAMTHLHQDHVGWNTVRDGDRWRPAFPNARYLMPRADLDYFRHLHGKNPDAHPAFADSVQPILDAGLADLIEPGDEIAGVLRSVSAVGHTPGQLNFWIGDEAVFCGDIFHHPLQIVEPRLNTAFCVLPEEARSTRREFLERAAATGAIIMPCHFGWPHCARIARNGDGYSFEPAPPLPPQRD